MDQYGPHIQAQYPLPSGDKIDLLIKDDSRRRWLVIELENNGAKNRESLSQLCDYMTELKNDRLPPGFGVEGMVISPEADRRHVEQLMSTPAPGRVHSLTFSMHLQLQPAPGSLPASDEE